jgi:agmatinase
MKVNRRSKEIHKRGTKARTPVERKSAVEVKNPILRKARGAGHPPTLRSKHGIPVLLGVPFDGESSYLRGAADAPPKIREALACDASNQSTETGVDLGEDGIYEDAGDLEFSSEDGFATLEAAVGKLMNSGKRPVSLGGDHSITYPILKAVARKYSGLTIFHFDAHPDLYEEFEGNRLSHACPFARIMEAGLATRLVQIGIRTLNRHQREQAERFGVEVLEMRNLPAYQALKAAGPGYISFDMDVLDPAYAPGISHREPGGMSVREAIAHLHDGQLILEDNRPGLKTALELPLQPGQPDSVRAP